VQGAGRPSLAHDKADYHDVTFGAGLSVVRYFCLRQWAARYLARTIVEGGTSTRFIK
jgi:hypothetical protein